MMRSVHNAVRHGAVTASLLVGLAMLNSCGANAKGACPAKQRIVLLDTTMRRLTPSEPFTVAADTSVWIVTTLGPDPAGLLGRFAGIADVAAFAADAAPSVSTDANGFQFTTGPMATLRKPLVPVRLSLPVGRSRLYTVALGLADLPVVVFSCPNSS